jgi:5-methylcytosine-specific restriction endonuclease McrA
MAAPRNCKEMDAKAKNTGHVYGLNRPACVYCGAQVAYKKLTAPRYRLTRDHFIPLAKGGPNNFANRVPACKPCNELKGSMDPAEFVKMLGERSRLTVEHVERARARILAGEISA